MSATVPVRVILVGRTGLDARLRLDPAVELVRVRTPYQAIGELSDPADPSAPRRAVVIVAPHADPARSSNGGGDRAAQFVAALRRVDPAVRVLAVGDAESSPVYDGVISPRASSDALRRVLRAGMAEAPTSGAAEGTLGKATEAEVSPVLEAIFGAPEPPPSRLEIGDEALVRLMVQGQDVTDAAVEQIRRRVGGDVVFVRAGQERQPPADEQRTGVPVVWRGRLLGRLCSRDVSPQDLATQAGWLAAWLALRDQHAHLRYAAFTDPLTGAYNRRFFDYFLTAAIEQARRERRSLTILFFDIDDLKRFNDRYGHAAGDAILVHTVRLLRSVTRPTDRVCRIGGDEFAVIFHEPTGPRTPTSRPPSSVFEIAQRFQREIANHRFPELGRRAPGPLTISGGLATYPWDGTTARELLARADELALQSKRQGKNAILLGPGAERECGGK